MSGLDEKAIAIAEAAYMAAPEGDDALRVFLRAYLASATPADVGEEPVAWTSSDQLAELKKTRFALITGQHHDEVNLSDPFDMPFNEPLYSATALERVVRERDEARAKLFPYADATEISGMSWNGFYLIGDEKSIKELRRLENRSSQIDVFRAAFDERIAAAEAKLAEARKVIEWAQEGVVEDHYPRLMAEIRRFLEETK